ncbi:DNA-directed RNA polymerase III subunit RPC5 [Thalassophryne amazonica]|uniref:DNA-directed RNA polymerase III subunit RPC5 n=1 Tax=Thalassophryne amazonica TaxID=390379 RepID=UPI001471EFB6|nr:DNA-directed RNA polymerase III subunit RPC5 [Thalassophryne amazonica]
MATGDDDDPIIEEIDVYLAKSLADKLYLFQYPVRPATMTYDDVSYLSAKIKPKQQRVELEVAVDTMSPNYCRSKGEQIALNVDGTTCDETNTYSVKMMDKQTFSSIQATTNTSRYAAAVFRKGELHVTPLTGILQLRPSFSYLDKADNKTREKEAANEGGDSSQDEAEEEVKAITVRFARPESEQARQRRFQSYEFLQKKQAEEPWIHLQYHSIKDGRSEHEKQYLFCQSVDASENCELVKTPKYDEVNQTRFSLCLCQLPPEDVKEFLEHVAVPRVNRGWEFLLPTDADFIKKHPDVAHRQNMLWLGIQGKLEKVFNFSKEDFIPKNVPQPEPVHISGEQRLKMAQERAQANQPSLHKDLEAKRNAALVASVVHVKQEPINDWEDAPMDTSSPSSSSIPNGSVNGYPSSTSPVCKSSASPELHDFVLQTFRKHFVLTLNELKRLFHLHLASIPAGQSPLHSMSDHMLQEMVLLSQCKQILVPFPAQSTATSDEQKVFGLWETGDTLDTHRQLLYDLFTKNYRLRRSAIQTRLTTEFGEVSKAEIDRLLKECCCSQGGMWYLKGTIQS